MRPFLPFASLGLLAIALTFPWLGWLSLVCLVPLFGYFDLARSEGLPFLAYMGPVMAAALAFFLYTLSWLPLIRPDSFAGIGETPVVLLAIIIWLILAVVYTLQFALVGWVAGKTPHHRPYWGVINLASAWVVGEYARSVAFSIAIAGHNGILGPFWNFGNLGLAAISTPLAYLGRLGGLTAISGGAVIINGAIYLLLRGYKLASLTLISLVLLGCGISFGLTWSRSSTLIRADVVQLPGGFPQYGEELARALDSAKTPAANVLVLPEYSFFFGPDLDSNRAAILASAFKQQSGAVITAGDDNPQQPSRANWVSIWSSSGKIISRQQKHFLIPAGEYLPYLIELILRVSGRSDIITTYRDTIALTAGKTAEHSVVVAGIRYAALACSGAIAPELFRALAASRADILVNPADLAIFDRSAFYTTQTKAMGKFMAIANARPFVVAAKGGYSYAVDANGKTIFAAKNTDFNVFYAQLKSPHATMPYTKAGEWLLIPAVLICFGTLINFRGSKSI